MSAEQKQTTALPKLTAAQRASIFPGPGNPAYARGPLASIKALERMGIVERVSSFGSDGKRGALLTAIGQKVRTMLERQERDLAEHARLMKVQERRDALNV